MSSEFKCLLMYLVVCSVLNAPGAAVDSHLMNIHSPFQSKADVIVKYLLYPVILSLYLEVSSWDFLFFLPERFCGSSLIHFASFLIPDDKFGDFSFQLLTYHLMINIHVGCSRSEVHW